MIRIDAIPLKQVNGIEFGTKREVVRKILGDYEEFKKSSIDKTTTDDFGYCHVFYNNKNEFEAIEIFDAEVFINKKKIFPTKLDIAMKMIKDFEKDDDGLLSVSQSIGIYAPYGYIKSILFGAKGYYEV